MVRKVNGSAALAPPPAQVELALARIVEGSNYRRRGADDVADLVESIQKVGVLQPVVVRPRAGDEGGFELVAGFRRFRAARQAGLAAIPVVIRHLSDEQVLEVQLVENLERSDPHPLDEADAIEALRARRGWSIAEIAARIGRSEGYVYGRLRLLRLSPLVQRALLEWELPLTHAIEIGRLEDHERQDRVLEEAAEGHLVDGEIKEDELEELLQWGWLPLSEIRRSVRFRAARLSHATWDLADAELVPEAGACTACPLRTAAQPKLFDGDPDEDDHCLKPACYSKKEQRHAEVARAAAIAAAQEFAGAALEVLDLASSALASVHRDAEYSRMDGTAYADGRVWEDLLEGLPEEQRPRPAALVEDLEHGAVPVFRVEDLRAAARAAGVRLRKTEPESTWQAEDRVRRERGELLAANWRRVRDQALAVLVADAGGECDGEFWRMMLRLACTSIDMATVAEVLGLPKADGYRKTQEAVAARAITLDGPTARACVVVALLREPPTSYSTDEGAGLAVLADWAGIGIAASRAELEDERKRKKRGSKKGAKKTGGAA